MSNLNFYILLYLLLIIPIIINIFNQLPTFPLLILLNNNYMSIYYYLISSHIQFLSNLTLFFSLLIIINSLILT